MKIMLLFNLSLFAASFSAISIMAATPEALSSAPLWTARVSGVLEPEPEPPKPKWS